MVCHFGLCFVGYAYLDRRSRVPDQISVSGVMRYSARTVSAQATQNVTTDLASNVCDKGRGLVCVHNV